MTHIGVRVTMGGTEKIGEHSMGLGNARVRPV